MGKEILVPCLDVKYKLENTNETRSCPLGTL